MEVDLKSVLSLNQKPISTSDLEIRQNSDDGIVGIQI